MIVGVVGNKLLPPSIRQDIIERTDGIPLFVEEMTKAVLETGSEAAVGKTADCRRPAKGGPGSRGLARRITIRHHTHAYISLRVPPKTLDHPHKGIDLTNKYPA